MPQADSTSNGASTDHGQAYGDWVAPKFDGALLIWPDAATLPQAARNNRKLLDAADHVRFGDRSLPQWRHLLRDDDRLVIATGHQVELHHVGVWIKNAVTHAVAEAAGGVALHVAVDTDAPKHLKLKWPGFAEPVTDDPNIYTAARTDSLAEPGDRHRRKLQQAAEQAGLPLVQEALEPERDGCLTESITAAHDRLNTRLGLPMTWEPLSRNLANDRWQRRVAAGISSTSRDSKASPRDTGTDYRVESWHALVATIIADANRFAEHYNAALADYREQAGIPTGDDRPMPDLAIEGDTIELPFWLDAGSGTRRSRLRVTAGDTIDLHLPGRRAVVSTTPGTPDVEGLAHQLHDADASISPRALTLTMYLRLMRSDLFVHGIGGGHYDQVLDRIMRSYFDLDPPIFAVASATLFHPDALDVERVRLGILKRERHRIEHDALGNDKADWLTRISAADDFHARRDLFEQMHAERRHRLANDAKFIDWQSRWTDAQKRLAAEAELFDRELWFAVQPQARLVEMIDRIRAAVG